MAKCGQTCIVMAGDDQQLGPKVYSPTCRHHGLASSIMERIVTCYLLFERLISHTGYAGRL